MNLVRAFFLALILVLFSTGTTIAQPPAEAEGELSLSCGVCEMAEAYNWGRSAPGKIGRGLVNIGLGWTNLFAQPIQAGSGGGSVLSGIGTGFGYTFIRTVQGVAEVGLFWLPPGPTEAVKHCALGDLGVTGR